MKDFDAEGLAKQIVLNMGDFNISVIEKSILVVQDVLAQVTGELKKKNIVTKQICPCLHDSADIPGRPPHRE